MLSLVWAHADYVDELKTEIQRNQFKILSSWDRAFLIESDQTLSANSICWAQAVATDVQIITFISIKEAQKKLNSVADLWTSSPLSHWRRSELILNGLRTIKKKEQNIFQTFPDNKLSFFSLIDANTMLVSTNWQPQLPLDTWNFLNTEAAPSRACLKILEIFSRIQLSNPNFYNSLKGKKCLELGSAPGGWTWVLQQIFDEVIAIDKGQMDPQILLSKNVRWIKKDAFAQDLQKITGTCDWFFSDLICYPKDLLKLVNQWKENNWAKNFICTLKFQGNTDFDIIDQFLKKFPGSNAVHLQNNKHEITWYYVDQEF